MSATLYTIDNNVPESIRVAIRWLENQDVGRELFEAAYALHGKPVRFTHDRSVPNSYTDIEGAHTINLDEALIDTHHYIDINENRQPYDMRQIMALRCFMWVAAFPACRR